MNEDKKPNNPPAFPTMEHGSDKTGCPAVYTYEGMTLRDFFAGLAMQGLLSHYGANGSTEEGCAEKSYSISDAMLKQREL